MQRPSTSIDSIIISNPKLYTDSQSSQESRIFPYYAGYSSEFSQNILSSLSLKPNSVIFDPWNGSGTTTRSALNNGYCAIGFDLNPAMVVVAKARLLSQLEFPSLISLANALVEQAKTCITPHEKIDNDPLLTWLSPSSAFWIRALEHRINYVLICNEKYRKLNSNEAMDKLSPLAAFFYVALFRTVRRLLQDFVPSNPTWVKSPKSKLHRKRPTKDTIFNIYLDEVQKYIAKERHLDCFPNESEVNLRLQIGNAENIKLDNNSVDAIISSPPYCTRIDYAVSTAIELSILGYKKSEFESLRRSLTGTSTVEKVVGSIDSKWGDTCVNFMENLYSHPSRASKGYYFKNHLQYFNSLSNSLREISRVLKQDGMCFLVAQDSYYKEIHNDVPTIAAEMANQFGLQLVRRADFNTSRSMVGLNLKSKKYISSRRTTESVLCFINC